MKNLCGDPKEHLHNHIVSGRRLIDNVPQRCTTCDGFGYLSSFEHIGDKQEDYICKPCNGTGKRND